MIKLALKKAKVPVRYSGGFTPRISLIYCPPAPVGVSVENDYFIARCRVSSGEDISLTNINNALPVGFRVTHIQLWHEEKKNHCPLTAVYTMRCQRHFDALNERAKKVLESDVILLRKKGKKEKDIRPLIFDLIIRYKGDEAECEAHLSAEQDSYFSPIDFFLVFLETEKENLYRHTDIIRKGFYITE